MPKYTQKWTLVKLLEDCGEGYEYSYKNWPLHVTLADVFAVDWESTDLFHKLSDLLASQKPVKVTVAKNSYLGTPENKVPVTLLQNTAELQNLHESMIKVLDDAGAKFNNPNHTGKGFIPHATVQKHSSLQEGDKLVIDSVTVIDMFPSSDGEKRKVLKTIQLLG